MRLHRETFIPAPLAEVCTFFSDPRNLTILTPPRMRFRIDDPGDIPMREGSRVSYRMRVFGVPMRWRSRITVWKPNEAFEDVQERGPLKLWHHVHTFAAVEGGTRMTDDVEWAAPFGVFSNWLVRRELESVFGYRAEAIGRRFR